ncbi:MAG: HupE/UreJ family protein [Methylococcales bacterium]|nr:HupE/UreJ family protein [Methylococcales bacterium]
MKANYFLAVILLLMSSPLLAHTDGMFNETLWQSLIHPLTGIDHLLVLVSVGLLGAKKRGYAVVVYPLVFLVMMVVGAGLNFGGIQIPFLETMIALSVILMGYSLMMAHHYFSFALLALFGVFHGYVHVSEIPDGIDSLNYLMLLLLSSFMISISAAVLGLFSENRIYQLVTWVSLGSGFYLLAVS